MKTREYLDLKIQKELNSLSFKSLNLNQWEEKYLKEFILDIAWLSEKKVKTIKYLETIINKRNRLIKKFRKRLIFNSKNNEKM